tara:strand:+ start:14261 stop:14725 length:465 start_codon:yes stop_codon:yes gene_type:complete
MSIINTAKELLKKGIALDDNELIEMANNLLDSATASPSAVASEEEASGQPEPGKDAHPRPNRPEPSDFLSETKQKERFRDKLPVNEVENRKNSFIDGGEDHSDVKTPSVELTPRREPSHKRSQVCESCSKEIQVAEIHTREFFICDECLTNRRR